jgi:hypothetical protein
MGNQKQDPSENQYHNKLPEGALTELPHENDVVREITPGRKAMNHVIIGLALSTFTLNFLYLNYILPTIGIVLMLLGFRCLRRENVGFKACWILSIIRALYIFPWLIINASIWGKAILESEIAKTFNSLHNGVILFIILCMGFGFSSVQKKAGIKQHTGSITALLIWYIVLYILGIIQYSGWTLTIPLFITYVSIIRSLYTLPSELDEAGYVIVTEHVRLSDRTVIIGVLFVLVLGLTAVDVFFNKYPMQWTPVAAASKDEAHAVKSHLITLGLPDTVVDDLTEEDLFDCADAIRVIVQERDHFIDNENHAAVMSWNSINHTASGYAPELHMTHVAVELPGNRETWKIIHHFQWNEDVPFYGTEAINLWPAATGDLGWKMEGTYSGQVLFDDAGRTYASPFYSLGVVTYGQDSKFWGNSIADYPFAEFSFPMNKENYRGYVSFSILETKDGYIIDSWIDYTHQQWMFLYPAQTAMENRMGPRKASRYNAFGLVQDALQFYPNEVNAQPIR